MKPAALAAFIVLAFQDPATHLVVGEISDKSWTISGTASVEDDSELAVRARRLERSWDAPRRGFVESKSERTLLRTLVVVNGKSFTGSVKRGPVGKYVVALSTEEAEIHSELLALGNTESLFTRDREAVEKIQATIAKMRDLVDQLERIQRRQVDVTDELATTYLRRVSAEIQVMDDLLPVSDLTASIQVVRRIGYHLKNVQLMEPKQVPDKGQNDPDAQKKPVGEAEVSIEMLRKLLAGMNEVISLEIKVSTTLILERLEAQAGGVERRMDALRSSARAASKLAEAAPEPDKDLIRLLDLAADRQSSPADIREQLKQAGQSLLLK